MNIWSRPGTVHWIPKYRTPCREPSLKIRNDRIDIPRRYVVTGRKEYPSIQLLGTLVQLLLVDDRAVPYAPVRYLLETQRSRSRIAIDTAIAIITSHLDVLTYRRPFFSTRRFFRRHF